MKLQLRSWFQKPAKTAKPVTAADLATHVAEAERDLDAALDSVDTARVKLAEQRTEEALQALRDAKAAAGDVDEMLTVLRADHATAVEREAAAARSELERQAADTGAQLTVAAIREDSVPLAKAEAAAILALAIVRKQRLDRVAHFRKLHDAHAQILFRLGQIEHLPTGTGNVEIAAAPDAVIAHLDELVRSSTHDGETLRKLLQPLQPTHAIYPRPAAPLHLLAPTA